MLPCEIAHPDWESERLVACKNPFLAAERAREREALLRATEADHAKVVVSVSSGRLRDPGKIGLRSGRGLNRHRMGKHCDVEIAEEARPDGIYVIRTSGTNDALSLSALVEIYESLAHIERDFRIMKRFDLRIRPIRRRLADRVPAHAFICLLAAHLVINLSSISAPPGRRSPSKTSSRLGAKSRCCSPCASDRRRRRWRSAVSATAKSSVRPRVCSTTWGPSPSDTYTLPGTTVSFECLTEPTETQRQASSSSRFRSRSASCSQQ